MNLEYSPGTPSDLFGKKVRLLVAQMTYPELVGFLVQHRSLSQAEEDLRDIGRGICTKLMEIWKPKARTVVKLVNQLLKIVWNTKLKYRIADRTADMKPLNVQFIDTNCKLCQSEREVIEYQDIRYCSASAGLIEALLNQKAKEGVMKLPYTSVKVETIGSKASGDPFCIHLCTFNY
ncbi:MAG: hypothetical protein HWN66_10830 [Candidatus Helarchaeota archaeon]|nr:hypothetical protein [Candidatus Helarchaeota archaeon]